MEEFDRVIMPDGRIGAVLEVFNDGEAYLVEFETPDGPHCYDDDVFRAEELKPAETE
ncbi:hypothetical protein [Raoultibacter massiliensis]|uniref:hypothetical protein n=1 Tax=Raoultibacter massiliensis TaxID=1852371 RepID=UPI003A9063BF